jgi:signal transduction histidine kinase
MLSAEIAHEIRNPLTVISLLFEALGLDYPEGDPRRKDAEVIQEKLDQLEGIVSRVLSFGKARQDMKMHHDLRDVVRDTAHLMRLKLQQLSISLIVDEPAKKIMIDASRAQLQQALLNLVINAMQAIGRNGAINLTVGEELQEGGAIAYVDVVDNGPGVPPELSEKIFDSFLSNKSEGTGLGLSIVKRILRSHQGDVELIDSSAGGTTMRIWLPGLSSAD